MEEFYFVCFYFVCCQHYVLHYNRYDYQYSRVSCWSRIKFCGIMASAKTTKLITPRNFLHLRYVLTITFLTNLYSFAKTFLTKCLKTVSLPNFFPTKSSVSTQSKSLVGKKLTNLANRERFAKIFLANIHRYTENVYALAVAYSSNFASQ